MTDRSKTVVLLIDWDNLQICHSRDAPNSDLDLQALIVLAQSYGTLVSARAYAEWNMPAERMAVYKAGIEPVFAPVMRPEGGSREGKSLADTVMVADGVDLLWTVAPDVFVLVTSDKDMIPLARIAKQRGAAVVVLGSDLTAIPLIELSNVFITYRQLLRELDRTTELDAPSGRAPARERRFARESRRPSAEPLTGARGGPPRGPARPPVEALQAPTQPVAQPAAPTAQPFAAPTPLVSEAPAATLTGDGAETVVTEGLVRRRRRRGGRSRGRGGSAAAAEGEQTQAAGLEAISDAMDEALAEPPMTITEATGEDAPGPDSVGDREPSDVVDVPPPIQPRSSIRQSRGGRASGSPPRFSEFGPPPRPPAETRPSPIDTPLADGPERARLEAETLAPADTPLTQAGPSEAPSAASGSPTDDNGAAEQGAVELAAMPAGGAPDLQQATAETTGGADAGVEASATESPAEEQPKPVRRRRTRAAR